MAVCLVPVGKGRTIPLDKTIILVGRHPDCDVVLSRSRKISRKHCCLAQVDNRLVIRDLGSMNGVWVNGERIQRQQDIRLGDQVAIGDVVFRLEEQKVERPKKATAGASSAPRVERAATPLDVSQDIPVMLDDDEFAEEPSGDVVPLEDSAEFDVAPLDEDQAEESSNAASDDYIPLADSGEL